MIKSNQHTFPNKILVKIDNLCKKPYNSPLKINLIMFGYHFTRNEFFVLISIRISHLCKKKVSRKKKNLCQKIVEYQIFQGQRGLILYERYLKKFYFIQNGPNSILNCFFFLESEIWHFPLAISKTTFFLDFLNDILYFIHFVF